MRNLLFASAAVLGAATLAASPSGALTLNVLEPSATTSRPAGALIKVHSRREVHDKLHEYGYSRVVYQSRYYDDHHKPVYQFRACQGRTEYDIDVNWYGHIIDQRSCGRCYGRDY